MKIINHLTLLIFVSALSCNGSCEKREEQRCIIQNNSREKVVPACDYFSTEEDSMDICIKPTTQSEKSALERLTIPANSSKNHDGIANTIIARPFDTVYIYLYNRVDVDNMSCEEFNEKRPILKEWRVTFADMEACDWTLVYP